MRVHIIVLASLAILLVAMNDAHGADGRRKGFVFGLGIGAGTTSFSQTLSGTGPGTDLLVESTSASGDGETRRAFAMDFRIGHGFNERFILHYTGRWSCLSIENAVGEEVIITNWVGGPGFSYYFRDEAPSLFVHGHVGIANWFNAAEYAPDTDGYGISGGVGWEFKRHWSLEATVSWGNPRTEEGGLKLETNAVSYLVTINALVY